MLHPDWFAGVVHSGVQHFGLCFVYIGIVADTNIIHCPAFYG